MANGTEQAIQFVIIIIHNTNRIFLEVFFMGKSRLLPLCLALALLCACLPAKASEPSDWLIPKTRDYRAFTDTAGTICESAAATCCETGLMDGVDSRPFSAGKRPDGYPDHRDFCPGSTGCSPADPLCILSPSPKRVPAGGRLMTAISAGQVPALEEAEFYSSLYQAPTAFCRRETFFRLLAAVLEDTGTVLPEKNSVFAVPDCDNQHILRFYRWGILGGKDAYGTLAGDAALSRAAAAALLARLIDPGQPAGAGTQAAGAVPGAAGRGPGNGAFDPGWTGRHGGGIYADPWWARSAHITTAALAPWRWSKAAARRWTRRWTPCAASCSAKRWPRSWS